MTEGIPPTRVQLQQLHQRLTEKVLDKACSDPQWKQKFIEDPELAMREANFPEAQELAQASQPSGPDVQGQWSGGWGGGGWGGGGWGGGGWGGGSWGWWW